MLTFLDRPSDGVLGVRASGRLTRADYQQLIAKLEGLMRAHGKVRMLFDLEDCQGWEDGGTWEGLEFALQHGGVFERCAVVDGKKWQDWMIRLSRPFSDVKNFEKGEQEKAWRWLSEGGILPKPLNVDTVVRLIEEVATAGG